MSDIPMGIDIHRQIFTPEEQAIVVDAMRRMPYRKCPGFLGHFDYSQYKGSIGFYQTQVPQLTDSNLIATIQRLQKLVAHQTFNTVFLQRYLDHSYVRRHRDPLNNIGRTIIGIFGQFSGAESDHNGFRYHAASGDVVIQDCTIDGRQGAPHSVDTIRGERYAVILNTIV